MNRKIWALILPLLLISLIFTGGCGESEGNTPGNDNDTITLPEPARESDTISSPEPIEENGTITLPEPAKDGDTSVEEALLARRSVRSYKEAALTLKEVGQLLWAAQGITGPGGKRTAPSAGALYALEVYVVIGNVEGITPGVYRYRPDPHELVKVLDGDQRKALSQAALGQSSVRQGAIDIVITAVYERITGKYGERGIQFTHLEAGHAAQNICLQAVALKLGTVTVGAFDDDSVKQVLSLPDDEVPMYIMPVGRTSN